MKSQQHSSERRDQTNSFSSDIDSSCYASPTLKKYSQENQRLRERILDMELKERQYVSKIIELEINLVKQRTSLCNKNQRRSSIEANPKMMKQNTGAHPPLDKESEETKFCRVMKKTYADIFGIGNLKEIWKKHKELLKSWMGEKDD